MNHYQTLGVNEQASQDEIKKSYRKLARQYHPDKSGGDEEMFKKVAEAYEQIGTPEKRQQYDASQRGGFGNIEDLFRQFGGRNFGFDSNFGYNAKGQDVRVAITMSLEEVYYGTSKYVDLGYTQLNINIPKGVRAGAKLRLSGKGQPHPLNSGAPPGDLIISISVLPNDKLIVNGDDIWVDFAAPFYDLIIGKDIEIKTLVSTVKTKIPSDSYDGKILRITGQGMPIYKQNRYGNLMVKLRASNVELNDEQRKLIQQIKDIQDGKL
jgi:curved DNA-binding protein